MQRRTAVGLAILAALGVLGVIVVKNREAVAGALVDLTYTPPDAAGPFLDIIKTAGDDSGVPWQLIARQLQEESNFNPDAENPSGAQGIAQLIPRDYPGVDPFDPTQAIPAQASSLANYYNLFDSWAQTLAAYNAGPGTVQKGIAAANAAGQPDNWLLFMPQSPANATQTRRYVGQILSDVPLEALPPGALT